MATTNYLDKAGTTYLVGKIKALLAGKVDKENGKGLSTNDYTTAEKTKLGGIATGAQVNTLESISVNGTSQTITNKNIDLTIPAAIVFNTTYDPTNNKAATMSDIAEAIEGITGIEFRVVQVLPAEGQNGVIYLVPQSPAGSGQDIYDEYIWLSTSSSYEKIGSTNVDLSDYVKEEDLVAITNAEIDAMFA